MKALIALCVRNPIFINILLGIVLLSGLVSAALLRRETFPEFSFLSVLGRFCALLCIP